MVCIGNSGAFGAGLPQSATFPSLVRTLIEEHLQRPVVLWNLSLGGTGAEYVTPHQSLSAGVRRIFEHFLAPGGHAFIGLYHRYGRLPFLEHFRKMQAAGADEPALFARYRYMNPQLKDDVQARSWFRDQVLHPHETQHTLAEMLELIDDSAMALVATSINRFEPIESVQRLLEEELISPARCCQFSITHGHLRRVSLEARSGCS